MVCTSLAGEEAGGVGHVVAKVAGGVVGLIHSRFDYLHHPQKLLERVDGLGDIAVMLMVHCIVVGGGMVAYKRRGKKRGENPRS
jgi:hypothetical protein